MSKLFNKKSNKEEVITEQEILIKEKAQAEGEKDRYKKKYQRKSISSMFKSILIVILIIIIILLLLRSCGNDNTPTPSTTEQGYITEEDIKYQDGLVKKNPPATTPDDNIAIPVIADFKVSKQQPYANLFSPEDNIDKFIIQYTFVDRATGDILYKSDWLKGGFKYSVDFGNFLNVGTYDVTVKVRTKDASSFEDKNSVDTNLKITVVE